MPDVYCPPISFTDPDLFRQLLQTSMIDWDIGLHRPHPLKAQVALRQADDVRAMKLASHPFSVLRGASQVARDYTSYIAVIYQQAGRVICRERTQDVTAEPGEIVLWHSATPREIILPDRARQLSMLIPADHFRARFPEIDRSDCLHLRSNTNTVALLAGCLHTLAENIFPRAQEPAAPAIDLVMDILGAALLERKEPADPQAALFERITRFVDDELKDGELTPATIAQAHGISVRYLHLLFSRRGVTVGGWIRGRRLEACRRALSDPRKQRSVTELAVEWGFCDAAHFSRAFKCAYGASPSAFRRSLNREIIRLP